MIETVHSNENGEGNLSNRMQTSFKMPKNIRQIGKSGEGKKIYLEDYVMTYIRQISGGDFSRCRYGVLVGQRIKQEGIRNIFVTGAVEVINQTNSNEIIFTNDIWTAIYDDIKKYFVDTEIVGWFIGGPGYLTEDVEKLRKAHVDNFAGQDKFLMIFDNLEKEDAFFCYENNRLVKQEGYYVYYEKNEEMQAYMIDHKEQGSSEADYDDKISRDIRAVIQNKKPPQEESKGISRLVYAAGTLLALIVLVVGAAVLNNYDQMQRMQDTLNYLSKNMEEVQTLFAGKDKPLAKNDQLPSEAESSVSEKKVDEASLDVESVPGEIEEKAQELDNKQDDQEKQEGQETQEKKEDKKGSSSEDLAEESRQEKSGPSNAKDTEVKEQKEQDEQSSQTMQDQVKYYTVEAGDTLAGISYKLYNTYTKVEQIMELNGIVNKDYIFVGQKLIVP